MSEKKYWVIIPAAGIGARMKADKPKQYVDINSKPMLTHVVDTFSEIPEVARVVVVLHPKDHWWSTLTLANKSKVLTVIGGKERVHSVLLGLTFLEDYANENDWVLVHDAARPCVSVDDIYHLMQSLKNHSVGGLLGLPVVDTLKQVDQDDNVCKTISRDALWRAQTPQMFRYGNLKQAIEKTLTDKQLVTDESSAIEYLGLQPKMILGSFRNIKVTMPEDLILAEQFL